MTAPTVDLDATVSEYTVEDTPPVCEAYPDSPKRCHAEAHWFVRLAGTCGCRSSVWFCDPHWKEALALFPTDAGDTACTACDADSGFRITDVTRR